MQDATNEFNLIRNERPGGDEKPKARFKFETPRKLPFPSKPPSSDLSKLIFHLRYQITDAGRKYECGNIITLRNDDESKSDELEVKIIGTSDCRFYADSDPCYVDAFEIIKGKNAPKGSYTDKDPPADGSAVKIAVTAATHVSEWHPQALKATKYFELESYATNLMNHESYVGSAQGDSGSAYATKVTGDIHTHKEGDEYQMLGLHDQGVQVWAIDKVSFREFEPEKKSMFIKWPSDLWIVIPWDPKYCHHDFIQPEPQTIPGFKINGKRIKFYRMWKGCMGYLTGKVLDWVEKTSGGTLDLEICNHGKMPPLDADAPASTDGTIRFYKQKNDNHLRGQ